MLKNPKVGDKVILLDLGSRIEDALDPLWGGLCGYVVGRISKVDNSDDTVRVKWPAAKERQWYKFKLLSPATRMHLLIEKVHKASKTEWFGTLRTFTMVALLLVVTDFIFLKGKGFKALKVKVDSVIDKTLE